MYKIMQLSAGDDSWRWGMSRHGAGNDTATQNGILCGWKTEQGGLCCSDMDDLGDAC